MMRVVLCVLFAAALLVGCEKSHEPRSFSSGSNWLRCSALDDCLASDEAVACSVDGFCENALGERIAALREPGPPAPTRCVWSVPALLAQAGVPAEPEVSCGMQWPDTLANGFACFEQKRAEGTSVQMSVNNCTDCLINVSYVATADGRFFEIVRENDYFGDDDRESIVSTCAAVSLDADTQAIRCESASELTRCSEPRTADFEFPRPQPVTPYKLGDPPADGAPTTTLHVYVSNQSFERPLVDIYLELDATRVLMGDFEVGSQHNWYGFDVAVPVGALTLVAVSTDGDASTSQTLDVPGERWLVVDYWYSTGDQDPGEPSFSVNVSETPVAFD